MNDYVFLISYERFGLDHKLLDNKGGRAPEISWHRTSVAGAIPDGDKKVFYDLVVKYWTLNNICVQFEYQCPE